MNIKLKSSSQKKSFHMFMSNPARVIMSSFALIVTIGTLLLTLPISSKSGNFTPFITAFFTATSATCVTGLVVVDTYSYFSLFGQLVILTLIQLGGLGLVTITTFFNILIRKKLGLKSMHLAQESINSENMYGINRLIKMIIFFTFSVEIFGAILLSFFFIPQFGSEGMFIAIFIAISAFCNAGFDILGRIEPFTSLSTYSSSPFLLIIIMLLIVCGGLGFIVWYDLNSYSKTKRLMLHTKIVLIATAFLIGLGAILILFSEWSNPDTIGHMNTFDKVINSLFFSVSCRTAGFNTFPVDRMFGFTKLIAIVLMFIGAAPGSTGGGVKITTFVTLAMTVLSVIRGKDETIILGKRVDKMVVYKSLTVVCIGFVAILCATCFISLSIHQEASRITDIDALFESVSAFATVGLSSGATSISNLSSRIILAFTMFLGRVGPVSIALSLSMIKQPPKNQIIPEGKIMVG